MSNQVFSQYLIDLQATLNRGDAREESFYGCLEKMLLAYAEASGKKKTAVTILPKATDAGNPDFRVWDGRNHITGYIEAKTPHIHALDPISISEQLKRYLATFPNLILTNFYEFRLYQHGEFVQSVELGSAINAVQMHHTPPMQHVAQMEELLTRYFSFSLPAITDPKSLADALARRTRFLRDEILKYELAEEERQGKKVLLNFYDSFKKLLINNLSLEQFADLYAQTLTYGIFAARTRSEGEFNRELIYKYIPKTLGVLKSIFKFISYDEPPQALEVLIDDIAEILFVTDIKKILHKFYVEGKGNDPIIHFYETFLSVYDPKLRESRGVYYTPEPVVRYIVRSIHSLLKTHFGKDDGLASFDVTLLDPAAGTLTFPAVAIRTAIDEYKAKYGDGNVHKLIKDHILPHFYAIELMMAPYTVGHLKIGYLLAEMEYNMSEDERFKLFLSNTLEPDVPAQLDTIYTHEITEECELANKVKKEEPILVIMGNPPYSGASENTNEWTEKLMKTPLDGAHDYYTADGKPLGEKNPKWLQDDYVKFLRFAQWKIHKAGKGILGMITNHGYLDNPTFRGMRQSLMHTFDEIYVLDLHGNSLKKEKCPDGGKDENVFDIRQGTAIVLMVKVEAASCSLSPKRPEIASNLEAASCSLTNKLQDEASTFHHELYGLRQSKYDWLESTQFSADNYQKLSPSSPFYLYRPEATGNEHYLKWKSLPEIFPVNSVGIVTARDKVAISESKNKLIQTLIHYSKMDIVTATNIYKLDNPDKEKKFIEGQKEIIRIGVKPDLIQQILYRPYDKRYIYYTTESNRFIERHRVDIMFHMLQQNIGLIARRQQLQSADANYFFVADCIISDGVIRSDNKGSESIFPLYLYPDEHKEDIFSSDERQYNIEPDLLQQLKDKWQGFQPEQLFYFIYAVLHSPTYRQKYAQYLRMDFPRIPFPDDYQPFRALAVLGKDLADLHLLTSPLLSPPLARYQGLGGNDLVEDIKYDPDTGTIRINKDKYFEGITPEVWNFHIGGYQVLHKYLKDRKGKTLADPIHYCKVVTALAKTIELQKQVDGVYGQVDGVD